MAPPPAVRVVTIVADRRPYRIAVTDQVIRLRSIIVLIG